MTLIKGEAAEHFDVSNVPYNNNPPRAINQKTNEMYYHLLHSWSVKISNLNEVLIMSGKLKLNWAEKSLFCRHYFYLSWQQTFTPTPTVIHLYVSFSTISVGLFSFYSISSLILGIFFVLPCIESYQKVDLRTITLGVPPQEVRSFKRVIVQT